MQASLVDQAGVEYNTVEVILQRAPDLAVSDTTFAQGGLPFWGSECKMCSEKRARRT
jgi:hypothetical protein